MMKMTKTLYLTLLAFVLLSCANTQRSSSDDWPAWVLAPEEYSERDCRELYFCVVGSAKQLNQAQAQARAEMAALFRVKVEARTDFFQWSMQTDASQRQASVEQHFSRRVENTVNDVLEGVRIFGHYHSRQTGEFFVIAGLNKVDTIRGYLSLVIHEDQRLAQLYGRNTRSSLKQALQVWQQRDYLANRLQVLGHFHEAFISPSDIEKKINAKDRQKISFVWDSEQEDQLTKKMLIQELNQWRYQLTPSAPLELRAEFKATPLQFNVEGFEKYRFELTVSHLDNKQPLSQAVYTKELTVRHKDQAYESFYRTLKPELTDLLIQLDLP